jgi:hypothetical protein
MLNTPAAGTVNSMTRSHYLRLEADEHGNRTAIELLIDNLLAEGAEYNNNNTLTVCCIDARTLAAMFSLRLLPVDRHLAVFEDYDTTEQIAVSYPVAPSAWCNALANAYSLVDQVIVTLQGGPLNFDRLVELFGSTLPGSANLKLTERIQGVVARLASGILANGEFGSEVIAQGIRAEHLSKMLLEAGYGVGLDETETVTLRTEQLGPIPVMLEHAGFTHSSRLLRH